MLRSWINDHVMRIASTTPGQTTVNLGNRKAVIYHQVRSHTIVAQFHLFITARATKLAPAFVHGSLPPQGLGGKTSSINVLDHNKQKHRTRQLRETLHGFKQTKKINFNALSERNFGLEL